MNERIYELAKQADLIKFDTLPWNPDAVTPDQESYAKAMKFAGLIMQECIDWLYFHGESDAAERIEWRRRNLGVE